MELIQLTASYSNAVMMMFMTNVTDVAKKLDLPVITPVQASHVRNFVCDPRKGHIGGWLTLTNGYQFWYFNGHVESMESPWCYFHLQDPDDIPPFYGVFHMKKAEAVQMARDSVKKLGYDLPWLMSTPPKVTQPETARQDRPKVVPRYRVEWERFEPDDGAATRIDIEINAEKKRVEMCSLKGRVFWKQQPNIPQPPVIPEPSAAPTDTGGISLKPLTESQRTLALREICEKATDLSQRLGLHLKLPIRPEDIDESDLGFCGTDLNGQIILQRGFRFFYENGRISSFHVPDSTYNFGMDRVWTNMPPVDRQTFYGKVPYTKEQIRDFAAAQVRKLGYSDKVMFLDQTPVVGGGPEKRKPNYARFKVWWNSPLTKNIGEPDAQFTLVEVDGTTLQVKSMIINNSQLRKPSVATPK